MPDLPIEILCEIFAYSSSSLRVRQAHEFPWYLGQVCSRWRALFFSMHSTFWKRIEINWNKDFPRRTRFAECTKAILAFFLNRTQGAPFSFSLFREGDHPKMAHVRWIIKDLLSHSSQWEEVFIRTNPVVFHLNLLRNVKGHLPLLKKLEITSSDYFGPEVHSSFADIFEDAPLLTHVVLKDVSVWEFNWSSLTILCLIGYQRNIGKTLAILQKTVNLVELTFGDVLHHVGEFWMRGIIHFRHLEYLSIMGIEFLTILKTPALRRLEVRFREIGDSISSTINDDKMVDFLCKSRLRLTVMDDTSKMNSKILLHTSTIQLYQ